MRGPPGLRARTHDQPCGPRVAWPHGEGAAGARRREEGTWAAYSAEDIPLVFKQEGVGWVRQVTESGTVIELSRFEPGLDIDHLFHGLPDDRCQCPHFGYVLEGEVVYRTAEGAITARAGQAYHIPPGHLPTTRDQACTLIEFSPADAMAETLAAVGRNMAAAEAS